MAIPTYDKIASILLDSSASSVTFDDIPTQDANGNSYKDLVLVFSGSATTSEVGYLNFNGDATSSATFVRMYGTGSASGSSSGSLMRIGGIGTAQTFITTEIFDYQNTSIHKTLLSRKNDGSVNVEAYASRYSSTSAITQIEYVISGGHSYTSGSTFDLYAIAG